MQHGPIGKAARDGDMAEVLNQTLIKVADMMDDTSDGRNGSALAIKIADLVDRIEARDGEPGKREQAKTEVTAFETISQRRAERRKAAEA